MSIEDLVNVYGEQYDLLRLATADSIQQLWLDLGGISDKAALEFAEVALDIVNAATVETATLVDAYVGQYISTVTGAPAASTINPLDVGQTLVDQLRQVPGLDVYRRPAITARAQLAAGKSYDEAMRVAGSRAGSLAATDIGLAHRSAATASLEHNGADGYRRTLTGASCVLCRAASTQRYRNAELMPIHTRCDCRVAPIVAGTDHGRIINRAVYDELKSSGELRRLNKSQQRAGSGQDRAAAAARRSTNARRQEQLPGVGRGVQPELNIRAAGTAGRLEADVAAGAARRAAPVVPAVRQHGELGPVLVNDRHAYTSVRSTRAGAHRLDADLDTVRATDAPSPAKVSTTPGRSSSSSSPPRSTTAAPPARPPRYSATSPEVVRAAQRRNADPEKVAAELNRKAQRKADELAASRRYARELSVDHPDVIRVADRNGVTPDEVIVAREKLREVRRTIAEQAARVQADAYGDLYTWEALKVAAPPKVRRAGAGEYDWLGKTSAAERSRLSRLWYDQNPARPYTPDQLAENINKALNRDLSVDDALELWLDRTRTYEAAGALRRGKLPSANAYSNRIDPDDLLPESHYLPSKILGVDDLDAAGYIAARDRDLLGSEALDMLGAAANPVLGPSPYRMSFDTWQEEVLELEFAVKNGRAVDIDLGDGEFLTYSAREAADRLEELVPYYLDEPGASFEELYARIITTAQRAGEEVPQYARVEWSS